MTVEEYMSLPLNMDILIKYSYKDEYFNEVCSGYYVVKKKNEGPDHYGKYTLTEALGEEYGEWNIEEVEDWAYCSELDSFFEERKQRRESILSMKYENEKEDDIEWEK